MSHSGFLGGKKRSMDGVLLPYCLLNPGPARPVSWKRLSPSSGHYLGNKSHA